MMDIQCTLVLSLNQYYIGLIQIILTINPSVIQIAMSLCRLLGKGTCTTESGAYRLNRDRWPGKRNRAGDGNGAGEKGELMGSHRPRPEVRR